MTQSLSPTTRPGRAALISRMISCAFVSSFVAACGDPTPAPADVVSDRRSDSGADMDSGVAPADTGVATMDTGVAPMDTGVAAMDTGVDAPPSNACCRAYSPANQSRCDGVESQGAAMCNNFDDGSICTWSLDARCNDSGVDTGVMLPNCCLAINPTNADLCRVNSPFGNDVCNRVNGGGTCVWSGAMICNPPTDSGVPMDARADTGVDTGTDARTDTGVDVRSDSGIPSCCLARTGARGAICRTYTTSATCAAQAATNTCVWSTTSLCTSTLGSAGACCIPRASTTFNATCAALSAVTTCSANANCQWRCP
ncbi:MAG: hypothetical protein JNK05_34085 [Myxococcales bacterium]|nr:hypothetical protein [Myxococcales bacterium]